MSELKEKIEELEKRISQVFPAEKIEKNQHLIRELEAESMKSDFWADTQKASSVMQKIADLRAEQNQAQDLSSSLTTIKELSPLNDDSLNLSDELEKLQKRLEDVEILSFLGDKYDASTAILTLHSGQGGVEAMDWAAMLMRMYLRFAENKKWAATLLDETKGEEAGIKEASIEINGRFAYGLLKNEAGTHRLVRQSPFNADHLRQTSFALVEVLPVIEEGEEDVVKNDEIEFEAFRSSGPGGQNVQKVNSAVRLRHIPTGITVTAQSERSQLQNRQNALKILRAKLYLLEQEKKQAEEKKLKGDFKIASWGNQIRSYVLHPYKQVKDLRTSVTSSNPDDILGGKLDKFIEAEIRTIK